MENKWGWGGEGLNRFQVGPWRNAALEFLLKSLWIKHNLKQMLSRRQRQCYIVYPGKKGIQGNGDGGGPKLKAGERLFFKLQQKARG